VALMALASISAVRLGLTVESWMMLLMPAPSRCF
jgi:hypothetical protein